MRFTFVPATARDIALLSLAGLAPVAALSDPALAAAASATPAATAGAETAPGEDEPPAIIVSAQRRREDVQRVPVSVNSISSEQIRNLGIRSTDDIGSSVPNVTIFSPNGSGQQPAIVIRGIGVNDFDTNNPGPNGIYVDDVFISAPSAQAFGLFDIDQIQVLKGPQGTLYGRNTSGGAVVFTSARPTDTFQADGHVEYGNYNTVSVNGAISGPITDTLDFRVAAIHNQSDGFERNLLTNSSAGGTNNEAVRLQLQWHPTEKLKVLLSATLGYSHVVPLEYIAHGAFQPGTQGSPSPVTCSPAQVSAQECVNLFGYKAPTGFYDGEWSRHDKGHNFSQIYQLREDYELGPVELTSISAFIGNNHYFPEDSDGGPLNTLQVVYRDRSNTFSQEIRLSQNAAAFHWVAGLYYIHESLYQDQPLSLFYNGDLYGGFGIPAGSGNFDYVAQILQDRSHQITNAPALYGQGDYTWRNFTLTLGGRLTYEKKTFAYFQSTQYQEGGLGNYSPSTDVITADEAQSDTSFTWKAGLSYAFTPAIMAYGSVATGVKSGDFNGSFLSSDAQQALFQLQPVKPEHVTSYEIGAKTSLLDRRLTFNLALFYNNYRDQQIFAQVPQEINQGNGQQIEDLTNILANAEKSHTEGVEVELTARPVTGLTVTAQPAWLNAKIDRAGLPAFTGSTSLDGDQASNAPHFSALGRVDYAMRLGDDKRLTLSWTSTYRSHVFFSPTDDPYLVQNGYWLHNLNIGLEFAKGWKLGAYVRNVTGTKYVVNASDLISPFGVVSGVPGAPRTFGGSLDYKF